MILKFIIIYFNVFLVYCNIATKPKDIDWLDYSIKQKIQGISVFTKLLNATNEIGSQSSSVTAPIFGIYDESDIEEFKSEKISGKYAVVIDSNFVNRENLKKLEATKKVAGIVVLVKDIFSTLMNSYSPDKECPNCEFGMYSGEKANYKWNKLGDGLLYENFNFPIFSVYNNTDDSNAYLGFKSIIEASYYNKLKEYKKYPLYTLKFNSFMFASGNAKTCLAREHCDPVGENSVWGSFSNKIDSKDGKKIIILSSQLDGNSLFHDFTNGVDSQLAGTVANLAIIDALSKSPIPIEKFPYHIVFTFFNGESYGYGGSQRFVQDISSFECKTQDSDKLRCPKSASCKNPCMFVDDFKNITLDNIKSIIELNQFSCNECEFVNYYMHVDDETDPENLKITNLISKVSKSSNYNFNAMNYDQEIVTEYNDNVNINKKDINIVGNNIKKMNGNITNTNAEVETIENNIDESHFMYFGIQPAWDTSNIGLPPSSSQSFLKKKKIPAVVISDFQKEFSNPYYHSVFDINPVNANYGNTICKSADIIAKTLWLYAQDKISDTDINTIPKSIKIDCDYVNTLMGCLSVNLNCTLVHELISPNMKYKLNDNIKRYSHYSGVYNTKSLNGVINDNFNYDAWLVNYALIKSTGTFTDTKCEHINNCTTILEYPDYKNFNDKKKEEINSIPYSKRQYKCINGYCVKGKAYSHPAYGIGLEYNSETGKFDVKNTTESTWTESRSSEYTLSIFLSRSKTPEYIELFIGILFVALTILIYHLIRNYTIKVLKIA
ncbi:hypothetical protein H8356DRAFT_1664085 [Neocallimastix lanati (nom. inval.)]|jgi:hypothetical protein|uniref:Nicastrin n=1 Tax=Neocallimastix californiae TaxID=1754190 RepID=A0A1Y2DWN0_9FUNG|nr:hypothetical protein H8356DRAFT_1664085 [Neocallimastix sp. JGI-2020a]ORY63712.1 hypothetical protein LY90DRAFT_700882 [Neocallimastix californiae]|eukprot:ORY63712.1 hypothetical protein LY90DRAFT_700882 [Neocallimastix californiae]